MLNSPWFLSTLPFIFLLCDIFGQSGIYIFCVYQYFPIKLLYFYFILDSLGQPKVIRKHLAIFPSNTNSFLFKVNSFVNLLVVCVCVRVYIWFEVDLVP